MVEYKIVKGNRSEEFEKEVTKLLNEGYLPIGNLVCSDGVYLQALHKNYAGAVMAFTDEVQRKVEKKIADETNLNEQ